MVLKGCLSASKIIFSQKIHTMYHQTIVAESPIALIIVPKMNNAQELIVKPLCYRRVYIR